MWLSELPIYKNDFLEYLKNIKNYSDKTLLTYQISLDKLFEISEIYEENGCFIFDINKYRINANLQLKAKTISKDISSLRSFTKYLNNYKQISTQTIGANSIKAPRTLPKPIDKQKIKEALNNSNEEQKLIISLIYALGLRVSELAGLKICDIRNNWVDIIGKGSKQRQVPLLMNVRVQLDDYIKVHNPKEYIFEQSDFKPYTVRQFQYRVKNSFEKISIAATPHQLRHSFATDLLNEGARINDVSELLGHSNLSTTNIYTKLSSTKKYEDYQKAHPMNQLIL